MVLGSRLDGGTQDLPPRVQKTIQFIQEIVGNHSDDDVYMMLKESNMDPNETAQKLLNQDTFHEVKRKKDKKKENLAVEPRRQTEHIAQERRLYAFSDRNAHRGGFVRNAVPGIVD
ncbi:hypothetical protein GIB67_002380 [Kingdonia uniflora]|uniref:GBF-interacting protein 1 N-terminal domain-containing protein n=1 Tax=Kingdonia uniflora TaxID=39325 RepID=A0A7J7M8P9_9MAGN|nr:hypothetical protein GIB67_002380 [Kingdonia uniflora]